MAHTPFPNTSRHLSIDNPITEDLHELLAAAVRDARHLNPHCYYPSFMRWHRTRMNGHCEICLAGSLIARTYRSSPRLDISPAMFSLDIRHKLYAVDDMRNGRWPSAYMVLYQRSAPPAIENRLLSLPYPAHADFKGWLSFIAHLDALEPIISELRAIELDAGKA